MGSGSSSTATDIETPRIASAEPSRLSNQSATVCPESTLSEPCPRNRSRKKPASSIQNPLTTPM